MFYSISGHTVLSNEGAQKSSTIILWLTVGFQPKLYLVTVHGVTYNEM